MYLDRKENMEWEQRFNVNASKLGIECMNYINLLKTEKTKINKLILKTYIYLSRLLKDDNIKISL